MGWGIPAGEAAAAGLEVGWDTQIGPHKGLDKWTFSGKVTPHAKGQPTKQKGELLDGSQGNVPGRHPPASF